MTLLTLIVVLGPGEYSDVRRQIGDLTLASGTVADESTFFSPVTQPDPALLVDGTDIVAVEIHQVNLTSSDISFNLSLESVLPQNEPPDQPTLLYPLDMGTDIEGNPLLSVMVSDPESDVMDVTFYGRETGAAPGENFTLILLPDTQFYSESYPEVYNLQMNWIVAEKETRNIVFVGHLGDIVEIAFMEYQWQNADVAHALLEDPITTGLADGIPYGMVVGNHDQDPAADPGTIGDEDATTPFYNQYFGVSRFQGRAYYGGHYDTSNDNHYVLFSASGMDFIVICLEWDRAGGALRQAVLAWADNLLQTYSNRRVIILTHWPVDRSGSFADYGQAAYDALKHHANLFLMAGGHLNEAARRTDPVGPTLTEGTLTSIMSNYQGGTDGGNGWLRIMTFSPDSDLIDVKTYSPWLDQYKPDTPPPCDFNAHNFTIDYPMEAGLPFVEIGTVAGVPDGGQAGMDWPGRMPGVEYEWSVIVSDSAASTTGPRWTFTSDGSCSNDNDCDDGLFCNGEETCPVGICVAGSDPCTNPAYPFCDEEGNSCIACVDNAHCDDGLWCTGPETCIDFACHAGTNPCLGLVCAEVSDICLSPVDLPLDPRHQAAKHRYLSIDPSTNAPNEVAIKVKVAEMRRCQNALTRACLADSDCDDVCNDAAGDPPYYTLLCPPNDCSLTDPPSMCVWSGPCVDLAPTFNPPPAWVVQQPIQDPTGGCKRPECPPYPPGQDNCCEDDDWMAYLGDSVPTLTGGYTSWADVWADLPAGVLHITDCGVVPAVTYAVYACSPENLDLCSAPLMVSTAKFPVNARPTAFPLYADVCGGTQLPGPTVLPPDGYVSVKDLLVENLTIINYGGYNLPQMHPTWADLHGAGTGIPPNYNLGVADLMAVYVFGLVNSHPYVNTQGGLDPQDCP
jgi:hypothetical protein